MPFNPDLNSVDDLSMLQQVARLQALLEASRQVHLTIRMDAVLSTVLRIVALELELPGALFTEPRFSHAVSSAALTYGRVPPEPWESCARFPLRDKEGALLMELVIPLPPSQQLSLYEQDFVEGLALQAEVAIENARYYERNVEWARVQQDLEAARRIQRSLLPQHMPEIGGYSVAVRSSACYEVGGDIVDIVGLPDSSQIMVVADVAGKGLASAIVSTAFRSAFRAVALAAVPLTDLASQMSLQHYAEGEEARRHYVTAIFLRLDPKTNTIEAVNAGHNPGFFISPDGAVHEIAASGTPIGLMPATKYVSEAHFFGPGSRLLFYTDGLTEVFHGDDEFGPDRLVRAFESCKSTDCDAILNSLWLQLHEFSGGAPQQDDMTALALMRIGAGQEKPQYG